MPLHYSWGEEELSIKCAEISLLSSVLDDKNNLLYTMAIREKPPVQGPHSTHLLHEISARSFSVISFREDNERACLTPRLNSLPNVTGCSTPSEQAI
jgi:hypothetical protein